MKSINKIFIIFASVILIIGACIKPDNIAPMSEEGGLLEVLTPSLNYVVGENVPYGVEFRVFQGEILTTKVEVMLSFHTTDTLDVEHISNEILFKTIDVTETITHLQTFDVTFDELVVGLEIDGVAIPTADADYTIGDYWELRLLSTTSDGNVHENYRRIQMAISTRFAGTYLVVAGDYFRIGVDNGPDFQVGGEVTIKSVDATTYEWFEWGALSGWGGNTLYFQIDAVTSAITYPPDQVLNGEPVTNPIDNPGDLTNVIPIAGANINTAIRDDVDGKDQLNMVHGYYTGGSGPREFYFLLQKVVN